MDHTTLLRRAREGDRAAREEFITLNREFVRQTASRICGRHLDYHQDEMSIALIAFNEAIDGYDEKRGIPFQVFARLVIRSRLSDHFRREGRLLPLVPDNWPAATPVVTTTESAAEALLEEERRQEVRAYRDHLLEYGLTLNALVAASPKHRDTRRNLLRAARTLAGDKELFAYLVSKKKLPVSRLASASGISVKALEKGRKYVVAVSLIFGFPERYPHLYAYLAEC